MHFGDSQKLLETKYADESGMKFFNAGDGGIEAMKDFILKMSIKADQQKKELYDLYKNSAITIGMLAIHQTKSLVEVWFDMMAPDIGPILCYTHDESDRIAAVVNSNSYAVIDCFTLLTCFILMRRPELLENVNVKWAVTNSTLEELQTYVNELQRKGPTFSVGVEDGELRHGGITQGYIDELSKDINQIISWCNEKALVKTPKRIARAIDEVENVADMIGQSSYDTLLLASELNGAVVSEDDKFKMLAFKEYGRPTFSSYQLALYNAQTALITPDDFKKCYMSLLKHNYTYIPVNGIDLWELYDENGFKVQYSFVTGVKGLLIMMPERAALTISDFAKRVYLNLALNPTRASVLSYIFRTIRAHRDWQKIKAIITIISIKHFELMPSQRQEFLSIMNMN